jgi:hypothetical protein
MFMRMIAMMAFLVSLIFQSSFASASEPAYCDAKAFLKMERGNNVPHLVRARVFQVGSLTLAGLAVGQSDARYTRTLAEQYSKYSTNEKSCTWYLNKGNAQAEEMFSHYYVSNPMFKSAKVANEYYATLHEIFSAAPTNMVDCAVDHKFVAMGCDGMKHRGPSVFAMFLAYSGCTPAHATQIANKIWGSNFVSTSTRTAIAQKGFEIGNADPKGRAALQKVMTTPLKR